MPSKHQSNVATVSKNNTKAVCDSLWKLMADHGVDAYWVPSSDEHLNEYLPEAHKRREFLTGFTGSAGDALVFSEALTTLLKNLPVRLFVDSRYYEQADFEVDLETVHVSRQGLEGHPRLIDTLLALAKQKPGLKLGFDPFTVSAQAIQDLQKQCKSANIELVPLGENLIDRLWRENKKNPRPEAALNPVYSLPIDYSGRSTEDKINRLQTQLKDSRCEATVLTKLDQIAWLLNLRGQDIPYNPVFLSYVITTTNDVYFFCEKSRIEKSAIDSLPKSVKLLPYTDYASQLPIACKNKRVLFDPKHATSGTMSLLKQAKAIIVKEDNPVETDKAIKNAVELSWMREAHLKAATGKIRAFHWLEKTLQDKPESLNEKSFADQLEVFYSKEQDFKGLSFNTIAGFGPNSSIVHYGTPSETVKLKSGGLFLVDSGTQYLGGTTDDTRTIIIGKPDEKQIRCFTAVLKAHINCASQIFPKGTEGARLDGITRATLWQEKMDYGHGTGHGVGAFLNVHEGPCGIHRLASKPLLPGMIVSIEPGYYEPGWGGIRCENLYVVVEVSPGWYGFESLTYIPFDNRLIDFESLDSKQADWLASYQRAVVEKTGNRLEASVLAWLKENI
ncbi:MAG: aminopeptidase P family protein [Vampirovibrionales bacterium]|nr:aminopeptidase P family protein [Vampirovibrionales bacterium]